MQDKVKLSEQELLNVAGGNDKQKDLKELCGKHQTILSCKKDSECEWRNPRCYPKRK